MAKVCKRNGRYVPDYYFNGERIRKSMPKSCTKKEAENALREIECPIFRGLYSQKEIPTFEAASDEWIKHKETKVGDSSWDTYRQYIANHLGVFDRPKVNQITTARVGEYISGKEKSGMPIKTMSYIIGLLNQIMKHCVRCGLDMG